MTDWKAIVIAPAEPDDGPMASRHPSYLHPVAGRPLVWHTVRSLAAHSEPSSQIIFSGSADLLPEVFEDVGMEVRVLSPELDDATEPAAESLHGSVAIVVHASASIDHESLHRLLMGETGD